MHVANKQPKAHLCVQRLYIAPRSRSRRAIKEHEENARNRQQNKQKEAESTKAERVADFHCVTLHLHRVKVIQDAIHDHIGSVPRAVGVTLAEN